MDIPNILFEKKYPHMNLEDYDRVYDEATKSAIEEIKRDSKEMCRRVFERTVRVTMPERVEGIGHFVDMAKELAEFYEIDTTVTEYEDRIVATFVVDTYNTFSGIKKIILFSDDICFQQKEENIMLSVIFYTHATYSSGRKITPVNDLGFLER